MTQFEYDDNGNQTAIIDPLDRRTEQRYDDKNQLTETIYPDDTPDNSDDNLRTTIEYDAAGNQTAVVDFEGNITAYTYNEINLPTGMILPDETPDNPDDNLRITVEYDRGGQLKSLVNEAGQRTNFELDDAGQIVLTSNSLGEETRTVYDPAGREIAVIDALGRRTQYEYDGEDRLVKTIFTDGTESVIQYDNFGNVIAEIDPAGRTVRYEYDALDRLTAVVQTLDSVPLRTEYDYDEAGNLVYQKDANGNETQFGFDGLGRQVSVVRPLGQRSTTVYDSLGNIVSTTDFNGTTIEFDYDDLNRLVSRNVLGEDPFVEYTYTGNGRLDLVTDDRGVTDFDYNDRGQLISRTEPDGTAIVYTYNDAGQVETVTTPSGTVLYRYDELNRLQQVVGFEPSEVTTYTYNEVGNVDTITLPNGVVETREYDELNRLVGVTNTATDGTVLSSYTYTLDEVGNRTKVEELGRVVEFTYDDLYRLVGEEVGDRAIDYVYDNVGNRLSVTDSVEGTTVYSYDGNDRLETSVENGETTVYTYDDNGNLRVIDVEGSAERTEYFWDVENRLDRVVLVEEDGTSRNVEYEYDPNGIRVSSIVDGVETRYLIDGNRTYPQVAEEYAPDGTTQVAYVRGLDLISQHRDGEDLFYLNDGHSGVRQLSNELGIVTDTYDYDAYGNVLNSTGTTENNYLYRGEQFDPNVDLQYLRARYYDPELGRFPSVDPFEGLITVPMSRHRYQYGYDNPIQNMDPTGAFTEEFIVASLISTFITSIGSTATVRLGQAGELLFGQGKYYEWEGPIVTAGYDISLVHPPFFSVPLEGMFVAASTCGQDEIVRGSWLVVSTGVGLSVPSLPVGFSFGEATLYSPSFLGPNSGAFAGLAGSVASGGIVYTNSYWSHAFYFMGFGLLISTPPANGLDVVTPLRLAGGLSIPIYNPRYRNEPANCMPSLVNL